MKKLIALLALLATPCFAQHYVGDYAPGATVCRFFSTYQPSTGAAFALASGAVDVYQEGSDTQDTDDSGATLTASVDSVAGMNRICVDTSTDGTFYADGRMISVVLTAGTVDSVSVAGTPILSFSLNKTAALRPSTAGRTLGVESDGDLTKVNLLDGHTAQSGDSFARLGTPAGASIAADLAALPTDADVNAQVDLAIETYHLDHLLAATYDPASKPGAADALLNELVENDAGVARFTSNALEQGPSGGGSVPDEDLGLSVDGVTASAGAAGSITIPVDIPDDHLRGHTVYIVSGTGAGQSRSISAWDNTTNVATVSVDFDTAPSSDSVVNVFATAVGASSGGLDAAGVRAAVGLASANLDTQLGNIDNFVDDLESRLGTPSNLGSGATLAANAVDIEAQTDDIGAAGAGLTAADDAVMTRLGAPAGASVSADVAAVKSDTAAVLVDTGTTLDALIQAIKAVTDQFTFTVAGEVDANAKSMNDVEILGTGTSADPWNGE